MAHKNKKGKGNKGKLVAMPSTSESYFKSGRARKLPLHGCLVSENWLNGGIVVVVVARCHVNGNISWGTFLVDLFCLGIRNAMYEFNAPEGEYDAHMDSLAEDDTLIPCDYVTAHNLIYQSVHYADRYGFKPDKAFGVARFILEEDDGTIKKMQCPLGYEGMPVLCCVGLHEREVYRMLQMLDRNPGPGHYLYHQVPTHILTALGKEDLCLDIDGEDEEDIDGEDYMDWDEEDMDWDEEDDDGDNERKMQQLREVLDGKRDPDLSEAFLLTATYYQQFFPEEKELADLAGMDDWGMGKLLGEAVYPAYDCYPRSKKEIKEMYNFLCDEDIPGKSVIAQRLIEKYPHIYLSYPMMEFLAYVQDVQVPDGLFDGFYRLFPDTPLARILYASRLLRKGCYEAAFDVVHRRFGMEEAFSERNGLFSEDEIFSFYALICRYCIATDDMTNARVIALNLVEINERDTPDVILCIGELQQKMLKRIEMAQENGKIPAKGKSRRTNILLLT